MTNDEYQGWSNYETWNVKLWLDNDEYSYKYWRDQAEQAADAGSLARQLQAEIEEAAPDLEASTYSDLLSAAISSVDWYEIAEAMIEEVEE